MPAAYTAQARPYGSLTGTSNFVKIPTHELDVLLGEGAHVRRGTLTCNRALKAIAAVIVYFFYAAKGREVFARR